MTFATPRTQHRKVQIHCNVAEAKCFEKTLDDKAFDFHQSLDTPRSQPPPRRTVTTVTLVSFVFYL